MNVGDPEDGKRRHKPYRPNKYLHQNRHDPWVPNDDFFPWRSGGGGGSILVMTPGGGISAMAGSSPSWTPGEATCTVCHFYNDGGTTKVQTTGDSVTVYNLDPKSIGGSTLILADRVGGKYVTGSSILDLQLSGNNLQYYKDGSWSTWHTATTCS